MTNQTNFAIENAISNIIAGNSAYKTRLGNMIIDRLSADTPAENIVDAIWQTTMINAKFNRDEDIRCKSIGAIHKPELYDISFYGFIQQIMDRACWNARAGLVARIKADAQDAETSGGNGLDFAQDLEDTVGFDLSTPSGIKEQIDDIYAKLSCLSADIAAKRKLDAEPLYMFAPTERLDSGDWVTTHKLTDWDEIVSTMNDIVTALNDQPEVTESDIYAPRKYA